MALILTACCSRVQKTPWGRVLRAVREDEDAARALGKNTLAYKLQSLAIAATLGAIAGFFVAINLRFLIPEEFLPHLHVPRLRRARARRSGELLGRRGRSDHLLDDPRGHALHRPAHLRGEDPAVRFMLVGLALILLMAFRPQGMFGKKEEMVLGD